MTSDLKCEVCQHQAIGVCSSPLGAISIAICRECLELGRQPWAVLVGGLCGISKGGEAIWVRPIIKATLEFYKKTEDELWKEVETLGNDLEEMNDWGPDGEVQRELEPEDIETHLSPIPSLIVNND